MSIKIECDYEASMKLMREKHEEIIRIKNDYIKYLEELLGRDENSLIKDFLRLRYEIKKNKGV
jgi:hypothetical protein